MESLDLVAKFIKRWSEAPASERANYVMFLTELCDLLKAVELALAQAETPRTAADLAKQFSRANEKDVAEILATLVALGRVRPGDTSGTYVR